MKTFLNAIKKYFADFGTAVAKGDIWCKLSLLVMGAGYWGRKQIVKGILMTALEVIVILFTGMFSINYIKDLNTLGTVQYESVFDPLTLKNTVNDYDNSLLILLYGIIGILVIVAFIFLYISNMKAVYRLQLMKEEGEHVNTFAEDIKSLFNGKFYITLLTLPSIGVIMMNIIPIIFMSCVAFTNYDMDHMPPNYLFTWVGLRNFKNMFTGGTTITFSYAFVRILAWTMIWAVSATFTTFIGGILLAKLINHEDTHFKKMWRSLFVVTIAIPQFVTLLLVSKMFSDHGIVNTLCSNIGLTGWLQSIGLVSGNYIPFLSKPGWSHVMIILINIWVGVPYQMLSATGILMNIPTDQLESARIDGANKWTTFIQIMLPIAKPGLVFVLIQTFLSAWNELQMAIIFVNDTSKQPLSVVPLRFAQTTSSSGFTINNLFAACIICLLPIAVFYIFASRQLMAGLTAGAVKG